MSAGERSKTREERARERREVAALVRVWRLCENAGDASRALDAIARVLKKTGR